MTNKNIAFYAPLKPTDHATPSGDRMMAQQLIDCLSTLGFHVDIASVLRVFVNDPDNHSAVVRLRKQAQVDIERLTELWTRNGPPLLWFCYHPYFKSPDLIGPSLCDTFKIPYVTAEASYSRRRSQGVWGVLQEQVVDSVKRAAVNICFTDRDRAGLSEGASSANLAIIRPFINTAKFSRNHTPLAVPRLVSVAMMRSGDKMDSYTRLAASLELLLHIPWTLSVVGDGPLCEDVKNLFKRFPVDRIDWQGRLDHADIATLFAESTLFVWPGCGEAYGLSYLEAQAAGLPVVAFDTAGVPAVVDKNHSGILTPVGDDQAYAAAIEQLLVDEQRCRKLSQQARKHVRSKHGIEQAGETLQTILHSHVGLVA